MKVRLTSEEKEIYDSLEKGEWVEIDQVVKEKQRYTAYVENTLKKSKRINIRISESDLEKLQKKASEEGLPYQTLISSVLHKYVKGKLQEA
ncbi:antitoxin [bacterium]|nr:antitoxin [bacterium]